jgi:hypothetical protein
MTATGRKGQDETVARVVDQVGNEPNAVDRAVSISLSANTK